MLAIVLLPLLVASPAVTSPRGDPGSQAGVYAAVGEEHLEAGVDARRAAASTSTRGPQEPSTWPI